MTTFESLDDVVNLVHVMFGDMPTHVSTFETRPALVGSRRLTEECRSSIAAILCALANEHGGGLLLLGVSERNADVLGVGDPQLAERLTREVSAEMEPPLELDMAACDLPAGTILAVRAEPVPAGRGPCCYHPRGRSPRRFQLVDGEAVAVAVSETSPGSGVQSDELAPIPFTSLFDLDTGELDRWCRLPIAAGDEDDGGDDAREQALERLGVLACVDGEWIPTVAGMVCFGSYPRLHVPGAWMRVRLEPAGDEVAIEGAAPQLVERVLAEPLVTAGLDRVAVREMLVNALAHRDYGIDARRDPVEVIRFHRRLEVVNPGGRMPSGVASSADHTPTRVRNPKLLSLLRRLRLAEGEGTGLRRTAERAWAAGVEPPTLRYEDGEVRATIRAARAIREPMAARRSPPTMADGRMEHHARQPVLSQQCLLGAAPGQAECSARRRSPPLGRPSPTASRSTSAPVRAAVASMLGPGERLAAREPEAVGRASALSNDRRSTDDRVAEVAALLGAHRRLSTKEIIAALGWSRSTTRRVLEAAVADGAVRATAPSPRSPEQSYEPTG